MTSHYSPAQSPSVFSAPSCSVEDALNLLTRLYVDLRLPLAQAAQAARADCAQHSIAVDGPTPVDTIDKPHPVAPASTPTPLAPWGLIVAAFAAVYVIWGSTYLAIRIAIETIPPLLMAGVRFLSAGALLYGTLRLRGVPSPRVTQWRSALIIGVLLLLAGNGGVTWAEQRVPSSLAALLVATVPLWMILLDWLRPGGSPPKSAVFVGLAVGFAGIALIVLSRDRVGHNLVDPLGVAVLMGAALCWAVGSIWSKYLPHAAHPLMSVAAQMLCGGGMMLAFGLARGEMASFQPAAVSSASLLALAYLVLIGALVGFTAYVWLLQVSTPARVSTYAYVNPFIAVLLGHFVAHEPITGSILAAGGLIIGAVILITTSRAATS